MKHSYYRQLAQTRIAVLDITPSEFPYPSGGYIINRINVPRAFRHQGIGTSLMLELLADADAEGKDLYLTINAYGSAGDPDADDLRTWYGRLGFLPLPVSATCPDPSGIFHRAPRTAKKTL